MRELFPGFYPLSDDEKASIWADGLIVLDTNALFNLFRYTASTREAFMNVLRQKQEQLWLPYQVALEFQTGRLGIIRDQQEAFPRLIEKTKAALGAITTEIGSLRNHPSLDLDDLRAEVSSAIRAVEQKIVTTRQAYESEVVGKGRHEATTAEITHLYNQRVGSQYSAEKLVEIHEKGAARYAQKVPPGYKDAAKAEPERYGDLILWFQILDKAEAERKPILFVSDDQKEDWWREFKGEKIGPRVELVDEFAARVGARIQFMTPQQMLAFANGDSVDPEAVREVGDVSNAQAEVIRRGADRVRKILESRGHEPFAAAQWQPSKRNAEISTLVRSRSSYETQLRGTLATMDRMRREGKDSLPEFENLNADLQFLRRRVIDLSEEIKAEEFGTADDAEGSHQMEFFSRVRALLSESSATVLDMNLDWSRVSDDDLRLLIDSSETHLRSVEFDEAVHKAQYEYAIDASSALSRREKYAARAADAARRLT